MRPGAARARVQETPSICHKTPEQWPVEPDLIGYMTGQQTTPGGFKVCTSTVLVTKQPFFNNYFWIGM